MFGARDLDKRFWIAAGAATLVSGAALFATGCSDSSGGTPNPVIPTVSTAFQQVNLVSNRAAVGGTGVTVDPNLTNPWGIAFSPAHPFWVADNHSGSSTLYDGLGAVQSLVVSIKGPGNTGTGSPTGTVVNSTTDFQLPGGNTPAVFIFATEDGTLYGWAGSSGANAVQVVDNSASGAVYKGLASGFTGGGNFLYATDFHNARVDVFDKSFQRQPVSAFPFNDPNVPAGFAPFGIQNIGSSLFVTYARQKGPDNHDDQGVDGLVDVYGMNGILLQRFASHGTLNSPWGVVQAPANFGSFGGALLVGNFGDGRISAFNMMTGAFLGQLKDASGALITVNGLWGLANGGAQNSDPNAIYFTAGPNGETDGLFGKLQAVSSAAR